MTFKLKIKFHSTICSIVRFDRLVGGSTRERPKIFCNFYNDAMDLWKVTSIEVK